MFIGARRLGAASRRAASTDHQLLSLSAAKAACARVT
jgi:hypothetical protein